MVDTNALYPSVVSRSYLSDLGEASCSYYSLGPNLIVMLSLDLGSALRNVGPDELSASGLTEDGAWHIAMNNLGEEIKQGRLPLQIGQLEDGTKIAFFCDHWLAAATVFHSGLYQWFSQQIGSDDLCAIISNRDSAIVYAANSSPSALNRLIDMATEMAAVSLKPFGRNVYRLMLDGPEYIEE